MKKVLIIFGGNSSEHIISCKSTKSLVQYIDNKQFTYRLLGIDFDGNWYEYSDDIVNLDNNWQERKIRRIDNHINYLKQFDKVFPLLHGVNGEDGKIQGMLDMFNIPYVGCDHTTSSILMDKDISKLIFQSLNIPQVPYITINKNYKIKNIINRLSFPLIVKPANGGSSIGISKVNNLNELKKAIKLALKYDHKVIIESFIIARELEVAVLKKDKKLIISKPGEIKSSNVFYDYNAKYENSKSYTIIPKNIGDKVLNKIYHYSKMIVERINIKDLARIDFFLDKDNHLYLNEINTIPGFTNISMYPILIENIGIKYKELITRLLN